MNKKGIFCMILGFFLAISLISASTYSIEYTQVNDKLVVKEIVDGNQISNQVSNEVLEKSSDGYYFVEKIVFNSSYSEVEVKFNLDAGYILGEDGVFPGGYRIETDGQVISVVWNLTNVNSGEVFPVFIKIKMPFSSYNLIWIILVFVLLIIIAYLLLRKKQIKAITGKKEKSKDKEKNTEIKTIDQREYDYLLDTEKKVIDILLKADRHERWQKQIQDVTRYSKAKVSRLIRNLEARNLIVKIPFGNTNKVRLK